MLTFQGFMGIDEGKKAVLNMDARAQQIPGVGSKFHSVTTGARVTIDVG